MKTLLLLLALCAATASAQTNLSFDKRFVESEDKWVAFQKDKNNSYIYGFIYIDAQAGLTFNYEGTFKISENGNFIPKKIDSANFKIRLKPNNVLVAFIPENKFEELQILAVPDWLKYYKNDTNSVERLYRWGYLYNSWDMCAKALTYLERAQQIDPKFKGLQVELAFTYNCLGQFDKAIAVLQNAIQKNTTDAYLYKELIFAQVKSGLLDEAAKNCKRAIEVCTDLSYNGEMCFNLLHEFYVKKDKKNFDLWLDETKKWTAKNVSLTQSIRAMENELSK